MKKHQRPHESDFICKSRFMSFKAVTTEIHRYDFKMCLCGSFTCEDMPAAVPNGPYINQMHLFYPDREDAYKRWIYDGNNQKSQLLFPAKGERCNGDFKGDCLVCDEFYQSYLAHTNTEKHKMMLTISEYNKDIQELCEKFMYRTEKQPRKRGNPYRANGRFAKKNGKNKKSEWLKRDKTSGKFQSEKK